MANNLATDLQNQSPGLRLVDGQALASAISGSGGRSSANAITASTTQTQVGGTKLTSAINRITTAAASDAVTLPVATPGSSIIIINDTGQTIQAFPATGGKINDAAANASVSIADNTVSTYYCPIINLWFGGATAFET